MRTETTRRPWLATLGILVGLSIVVSAAVAKGEQMAEMKLTSLAFEHGESIPAKFTCQGADISPPLSIEGVPAEAESLVLVVDDPDAPAGTWDHWILFDIPPGTAKIPEDTVPPGAIQGANGWGDAGYGGPCPPSGEHR